MSSPLVDFTIPQAKIRQPPPPRATLKKPFWDAFADETTREIFERGGLIIDIGGGLRIDPNRGAKVNPQHREQFFAYLQDPNVQYRVTGYTDKYHPDLIEDIHRLSFADGSVDGLFCLAVLEHVYDPKRAAEEVVRVLKKGGIALLYLPFIYRYHANSTEEYRDYYRYSKDGISYLFRGCSELEICPVRGLFETLLRFTPLHSLSPLRSALRILDWGTERMRRLSERQTSGYFVRIRK